MKQITDANKDKKLQKELKRTIKINVLFIITSAGKSFPFYIE